MTRDKTSQKGGMFDLFKENTQQGTQTENEKSIWQSFFGSTQTDTKPNNNNHLSEINNDTGIKGGRRRRRSTNKKTTKRKTTRRHRRK